MAAYYLRSQDQVLGFVLSYVRQIVDLRIMTCDEVFKSLLSAKPPLGEVAAKAQIVVSWLDQNTPGWDITFMPEHKEEYFYRFSKRAHAVLFKLRFR